MGLYSRFLCHRGQIISPLVYDESWSYQQQIAHLFGLLKQLNAKFDDYVLKTVFNDFVEFVEKDQEEQTEYLKQYTDEQVKLLKQYLEALIEELTIDSTLIWNVTLGKFTNNIDAMRDTFNDVTVHAETVDTINNVEIDGIPITVDSLTDCGLNVRGLAIYSGWLTEDFQAVGVFYEEPEPEPSTVKLTSQMLGEALVRTVDGAVVTSDYNTDPINTELKVQEIGNADVTTDKIVRRSEE